MLRSDTFGSSQSSNQQAAFASKSQTPGQGRGNGHAFPGGTGAPVPSLSQSTLASRLTSVSRRSRAQTRKPAFVAEISSPALLLSALKGLVNGKKDQHAICEADTNGLRFITADQAMVSQGCANLLARLFDIWELSDGSAAVSFRVSLAILVQCLGSLGAGGDITLNMAYYADEETLSLRIIEFQAVTECKIRTLADVEEPNVGSGGNMPLRSEFRTAEIKNKCVVTASQLREAFSMLQDMPGAATVSVLLSPNKPFFRLSTYGQLLSCIVDFPQGDESLANFTCKEEMTCTYRLSLLQQAGRALQVADKTSIRMNANGTLSFQHILTEGESKQAFVDYYILADVDSDDEDMDQQSDNGDINERTTTQTRGRVDSDNDDNQSTSSHESTEGGGEVEALF
mmetsp:Transcript_942/g.1853  ORF Transcript_942/g.1853 Transcript_942/m.1853 type:complete len:399 (+) Transcript_942:74-1270(+)